MGATLASTENRDRVAAAPEWYVPQYGGYCVGGVAHGYTAAIDPEAWRISDSCSTPGSTDRIQRPSGSSMRLAAATAIVASRGVPGEGPGEGRIDGHRAAVILGREGDGLDQEVPFGRQTRRSSRSHVMRPTKS